MNREKAIEIINRIDELEKKINNDANIRKEIIKRVRQFLQNIEDNTDEYEDCNFNRFDLYDISNDDLINITNVFNQAEKIEAERLSLEKDIRDV